MSGSGCGAYARFKFLARKAEAAEATLASVGRHFLPRVAAAGGRACKRQLLLDVSEVSRTSRDHSSVFGALSLIRALQVAKAARLRLLLAFRTGIPVSQPVVSQWHVPVGRPL